MPLENADFIEELNPAWPTGTDPKNEGDNHLREIKGALHGSFPGMNGAWNTNQKVRMAGADMSNSVVENVADGADPQDAVNQQQPTARVPGFISWGSVAANGSITGAGSGDFSVNKLGTGLYELVFNRQALPDSNNQAVTGNPLTAGNEFTCGYFPNIDGLRVNILVQRNGSAQDQAFSFMRMVL